MKPAAARGRDLASMPRAIQRDLDRLQEDLSEGGLCRARRHAPGDIDDSDGASPDRPLVAAAARRVCGGFCVRRPNVEVRLAEPVARAELGAAMS
jgi:hypothetical protein